MSAIEPVAASGWHAELRLRYGRRAGRTVLASRRHEGPLVVQKPLYPEGEGVCHTLVVHPPAGIAGGDRLALDVALDEGAHALLTTPGAGKWYRSAGLPAVQELAFAVGDGACLEWLPQETIVYDGAIADTRTCVRLAGDASFVGWEIVCLGRTGSGERYERARCRLATAIRRGEDPLWLERGDLDAGGLACTSRAGLGGRSVCGTLLAVSPRGIADDVLAACRSTAPRQGEGAVTRLPQLLAARYLGDSGEAARAWFVDLWRRLRPALAGRAAVEPRIWRT